MISVCLAAYNGEKYIKEQIDSILCQLEIDDELIVSDDNSTDDTYAVVQSINDKRIKLVRNNGMNGYAHNFENALKHATGDYIFFSDQDDVWLSDKIQVILKYLDGDNFVISDAYITDENLNIKGRLSEWRKYKKGYFRNLRKSVYTGCTCAFTKKIKDYSLPFPQTKFIQHDNWIGLLCELKYNVIYIDIPLILYRRHDSNTSLVGSKSKSSILFMLQYRLILLLETVKKILNN